VLATLAEYERVRAVPEQSLAKLGHADEAVERVVVRSDRFLITEKLRGAPEASGTIGPRR
jgi:hypothetical protein